VRLLERVYFGPGDWIATCTTARQRRAFGFWNVVLAAAFAVPFGSKVLYVTILSIVALIPNITSETPVEKEDDVGNS
jgi:hypothetical protein